MIKLGLVRLYLSKVAVVEVSRVSQICVSEDNDASSFVADGQELARFVKAHCCEDIHVRYIRRVTLTEAIDIHPVEGFLSDHISVGLGRSCRSTGRLLLSRLSHRYSWDAGLRLS